MKNSNSNIDNNKIIML